MARTKVVKIPDAALNRIPAVAQYRMAQHGAEIKIGRAKQSLPASVVLPEVHSQKWGGECWLKIIHADINHIKAVDKSKEFVNSKGGKGVEIPVSAKGRKHKISEGSVEWDIEYESVDALPTEYEIFTADFPVGLTWHKQLELTAKEIAEGCTRPIEIINSFAVYWNQAGRFLNSAGEELVNYETGKFCHINRPIWIDAEGRKFYGDQDFVDGQIRIYRPPQEWIDSAVLPITLDPVFGYSSVGGSSNSQSTNRTQVFGPFTPGVSGTITAIASYMERTATAVNWSVGAYSGASDPANLIVASERISPSDTTPHWEEVTGLAGEFSSTDNLYVGTWSEEYPVYTYYFDNTGSTWFYIAAEWPDPMAGESSVTRRQSTYATYTESGGGTLSTSTAWKIYTRQQLATAWKVLTSISTDSSWKIYNADSQQAAWRIKAALQRQTGWKLFNAASADTGWKVYNAAAKDTAWKILQAGSASVSVAWKIYNDASKDTAWSIKAQAKSDTAWKILQAGAASINVAWKIYSSKSQSTAWKLFASASVDTGWKVYNVTDQATSWRIKAQAQQQSGWKIFNSADIATAWAINSELIPDPVKTFYAPNRDVLFHAPSRTLIFLAPDK